MDHDVPHTGSQDNTAAVKKAIYGEAFNAASDVIQKLIEGRIGYFIENIERQRQEAGVRFDVRSLDVHISQINRAKADSGLMELQDIFNTTAFSEACDGFVRFYSAVREKGHAPGLRAA